MHLFREISGLVRCSKTDCRASMTFDFVMIVRRAGSADTSLIPNLPRLSTFGDE